MREQLAQLAHEQWSDWIKYMFGKCHKTSQGELIIPPWAVERWSRQAKTAYCDLTEAEKDCDRAEADKFLIVFELTLKSADANTKIQRD